MNATKKTHRVHHIESLLLASYYAFLAASPAIAAQKLQEWDQLTVTTAQTTADHDEILAVLQGTRSGSDVEFVIFGRLADTARTLEQYAAVHASVSEKLKRALHRGGIFSDNETRVRIAKLRTLTSQLFENWDNLATKKLGQMASREHAQLISRLCPQGGKTSSAITDRLATIAVEEQVLAEQEKKKASGGDKAKAV